MSNDICRHILRPAYFRKNEWSAYIQSCQLSKLETCSYLNYLSFFFQDIFSSSEVVFLSVTVITIRPGGASGMAEDCMDHFPVSAN